MKLRLMVILPSLAAVAGAPAIAGTETGFIKAIHVRDSDGLIWVDLTITTNPGPLNHPQCAWQPYWILPNESSQSAKELFATLLAAQVSGRKVTLIGKNTCTRWPDGEDIESVGVNGVR
jgi:hypothetical protein